MSEVIEFERVSKIFQRHTGGKLIRHHFREWLKSDPERDFYALKDVSFRISEGESVAIVGRNGAGKSTLLSLVCGLSRPEQGRVEVTGQLAALLELGSGFHPDLTGAENVLAPIELDPEHGPANRGGTRRAARPRLRRLRPQSESSPTIPFPRAPCRDSVSG